MTVRLAATCALGLLAGCATMREPPRTVSYACERGPMLRIEYRGESALIVSPHSRGVVMRQRASASGFFYASATHSIRGKGEELIFAIGRMAPITCRARP
jgi:membrane-bound inhibitor of C-type lysozyme